MATMTSGDIGALHKDIRQIMRDMARSAVWLDVEGGQCESYHDSVIIVRHFSMANASLQTLSSRTCSAVIAISRWGRVEKVYGKISQCVRGNPICQIRRDQTCLLASGENLAGALVLG